MKEQTIEISKSKYHMSSKSNNFDRNYCEVVEEDDFIDKQRIRVRHELQLNIIDTLYVMRTSNSKTFSSDTKNRVETICKRENEWLQTNQDGSIDDFVAKIDQFKLVQPGALAGK